MPSLDVVHRPRLFKAFHGNYEVVESLKAHLDNKKTFPACILFKGPSGCGKTTLTRIVVRRLRIKTVMYINVGDTRKLEDARQIISSLRYSSIDGQGKVIVLNECHEALGAFQDALLEIMEEPPENVYFILCTTDPQKLLKAVKTRCTHYEVSPLSKDEMEELLENVCKKEDIDISARQMGRIITAAEGIPRSALLILNSIKDVEDPETQKGIIDGFNADISPDVLELCRTLLKNPSYRDVMEIVKNLQEDPERVRRGILTYMGKVLLGKPNKAAALIMDNCFDSWYFLGKNGMILAMYHILKGG